jgi:hypothetical protein
VPEVRLAQPKAIIEIKIEVTKNIAILFIEPPNNSTTNLLSKKCPSSLKAGAFYLFHLHQI